MYHRIFLKLALASACIAAFPIAGAAATLPSDKQLVIAINKCVISAWPAVTIDNVSYDPPLASVYYTPGPADSQSQYFVRRPNGTWKCVTSHTSPYLNPLKTWSALQGAAAEEGVSVPATQTADFILHRRGQISTLHATYTKTAPMKVPPQ